MRHPLERPASDERPRQSYGVLVPDLDEGGMWLGCSYAVEGQHSGTLDTPDEVWAMVRSYTGRKLRWWLHDTDREAFHLIPRLLVLVARDGFTADPHVTNAGKMTGLTLRDRAKHVTRLCSVRSVVDLERAEAVRSLAPGAELHANPAVGLLAALVNLDAQVHAAFGVHVRPTAGATALAAFKRTVPPGVRYWKTSPTVRDFVRRAYHGGTVWAADDQAHADCVTVDRNGAYAHAMRGGVPYGRCVHTYEEEPGRVGYYEVRIRHAPAHAGPPIFQWGVERRTAVCTSAELAEARSLGYVLDVVEGYTFAGIAHPFEEVVSRCEALERRGNGWKVVAKLVRNSLYGKFGSRPDQLRYALSATEPEGDWTPVWRDDSDAPVPVENLWQKMGELDTSYQMVEWAAWITAAERIAAGRLARSTGAFAVACDAVTVPRTHLVEVDLGTAYGSYKVAHGWAWVAFPKPGWTEGEETDGAFVAALAGIPRSAITREAAERGLDGEETTATWTVRTGAGVRLKGDRVPARTRTVSLRVEQDEDHVERIRRRHAERDAETAEVVDGVVLRARRHALEGVRREVARARLRRGVPVA